MRKKTVLVILGLFCLIMYTPYTAKAAPPASATAKTLTLSTAIATALANNQSIIQANLGIDLATARYQETKNAFNPQVAISETAGRQSVDSFQTSAYNFGSSKWQKVSTNEKLQNNYGTKIALQVPLYTGRRLEANREQAEQIVEQSNANAQKAQQALILDTTTAYFTLLQTYNTLDLARQGYEQMQSHLKNATLNYENGIVAKSDVLRAEVELAAAEQSLVKAENSVQLAQTTLCNILGVDLHTDYTLSHPISVAYPLESVNEYIRIALQKRPELKAMDAQLHGAAAAITAAQSGKLPTVALTGAYEWTGDSKNNPYPPGYASWSIMLNASWNVFDGGITASKVTQTQTNLLISQSQQKQLFDNIVLEVTQANFNVQDTAKRLATAQKAAAKADEDFRIAQRRYSAGLSTNVEVLDSHVAFLNAKNNFIQTQFDYHISYAKLLKAAGILDNTERMNTYEK